MVRLRTLAFGLMCAAAAAGATTALGGGAASGRGHPEAVPNWWRPPADVRRMLARISPAQLRQRRPQARRRSARGTRCRRRPTRTAASAPRATGSSSEFDKIAATSGGRMTTELAELRPAAVSDRIPVPTRITNVVATLQGHRPVVGRPRLRRHRALRLAPHRRARRHRRRARRQRRRVRHLGRARARARDGEASRPRRRSCSSPWPARSRACTAPTTSRRSRRTQGWNIQGDLNMDIIGSPLGGNGVQRPAHDPAVLRGRADERRRPRRSRALAVDRRRERQRRRASSPATSRRPGENRRHRHERQARLAARPLPARRRPDLVPAARLAGRAVHRAERELRPPAPGRARRERQAVRRPAAVRRLPTTSRA